MNCEHIRAKLVAYAEGQLPANDRKWVAAHVRQCAACRRALSRIDVLTAVFIDAESRPAPEGLAARIVAKARNRHHSTVTRKWAPLGWWWESAAAMRIAAAAVFAVGLAAGLMMGQMAAPEAPSRPNESAALRENVLDGYARGLLGEPEESLPNAYFTHVLVNGD